MPFKVEKKGNFLVITDSVSRDQYLREALAELTYIRDSGDRFAFLNKAPRVNSYKATELNLIGYTPSLDQTNHPEPLQGYVYESTEIVDSAGIAIGDPGAEWATVDDFDTWLSENLGFRNAPIDVVVEGGEINTVTDPLLLTETYRLRTSELYSQLDLKQIHDNLPLFYDVVTGGAGTNTHSATDAWSTMQTTNPGDYVIAQTKQRGNYQSGKPLEVLKTFCKFTTVADQEIRVGYFSSSTVAPYDTTYDGFFLSSIDGVVSVEVWKTGVQTSIVNQSAWNDPLDGTGESGKTVDWDKIQFSKDSFLWLGVDGITFFLKIEGALIPFHTLQYENVADAVYMSSPNQPLRFEVRQIGATPIEFKYICSAIGSDGSINITGKDGGADDNGIHLDANNRFQWYYAIGFRLQAAKIDTLVDIISGSLLSITNDAFLYRILLNPTYDGTVTYNDITDYAVSYGLGQTGNTIITNGHILQSGNGAQNASVDFNVDNALRLGAKIDGTLDEIVVVVKPLSVNLDIHRALNFREQI